MNTFPDFSEGTLAEQVFDLVVLSKLFAMVVVEGRHFKYGVESISALFAAGYCSVEDLLTDDLDILAMHLAFHFLDLLLLNTYLYPSIFKLRY